MCELALAAGGRQETGFTQLLRQKYALHYVASYLLSVAPRFSGGLQAPPGDPPRRQDEAHLDDREGRRDERERSGETLDGGAVEEAEEGDARERQQGLRERQHRVDLADVLSAHNL